MLPKKKKKKWLSNFFSIYSFCSNSPWADPEKANSLGELLFDPAPLPILLPELIATCPPPDAFGVWSLEELLPIDCSACADTAGWEEGGGGGGGGCWLIEATADVLINDCNRDKIVSGGMTGPWTIPFVLNQQQQKQNKTITNYFFSSTIM